MSNSMIAVRTRRHLSLLQLSETSHPITSRAQPGNVVSLRRVSFPSFLFFLSLGRIPLTPPNLPYPSPFSSKPARKRQAGRTQLHRKTKLTGDDTHSHTHTHTELGKHVAPHRRRVMVSSLFFLPIFLSPRENSSARAPPQASATVTDWRSRTTRTQR